MESVDLIDSSNGDGRTAEEAEEVLRGAQKLASRLQKAVSSGRSSKTEMKIVDRFLSRQLTNRTASILENIDRLVAKSSNFRMKERLSKLYLQIMEIFDEFKSMETQGYTLLVKPNGITDRNRLSALIDIDTELSASITNISSMIASYAKKGSISNSDYEELCQIFEDISHLLNERHSTISKRR